MTCRDEDIGCQRILTRPDALHRSRHARRTALSRDLLPLQRMPLHRFAVRSIIRRPLSLPRSLFIQDIAVSFDWRALSIELMREAARAQHRTIPRVGEITVSEQGWSRLETGYNL